MTRAFKFCCGASGSKRTIPNFMKPERYKEIERLYHLARERAPEQREAFLQRACDGDEDLCQEVESLLAAEIDVGSFLAANAMKDVAKMLVEEKSLMTDSGSW